MASVREPDPLEDALDELIRAAQEDIERVRRKDEESGELIEDADSVTFVLMAPGYASKDLRVTAEADRLMVRAYDLSLTRTLPSAVEPSTTRSTYLNGVLSVRIGKKL